VTLLNQHRFTGAAVAAASGLAAYDAVALLESRAGLSPGFLIPAVAIVSACIVVLTLVRRSQLKASVLATAIVASGLIAVVAVAPVLLLLLALVAYALPWNTPLLIAHGTALVLLLFAVALWWREMTPVSKVLMLGLAAALLVALVLLLQSAGIVVSPLDLFRLRLTRAILPVGALLFGLAVALVGDWLSSRMRGSTPGRPIEQADQLRRRADR
jgi:hypothetical protein